MIMGAAQANQKSVKQVISSIAFQWCRRYYPQVEFLLPRENFQGFPLSKVGPPRLSRIILLTKSKPFRTLIESEKSFFSNTQIM